MSPYNSVQKSDSEISECVHRLLAGPHSPDSLFCLPDSSYADLYGMAADLFERLCHEPQHRPVCLCSADKTTIAAALIVALAGGPTLILPYAHNTQVMTELHQLTGATHAIVDAPVPMPESVKCIVPRKQTNAWPPSGLSPIKEHSQWLQLFTGGSTGTPKMWTKTVRNLLAETLFIIKKYEVMPADRVVSTVSGTHIYGLLYAILAPLLSGASVSGRMPSFPNEIESTLEQHEATILVSVPAHYRALKGHPISAPALRLAFSSAGMLPAEDAHAFSDQTGVGIAEIYGSTETGGIAARIRARGETDFKPNDNICVEIENGQLKVRSDYLSPELDTQDDGYYLTADRAKTTQANRFTLIGRVDGIVKVGGRRVDLELVRHQIKQISHVTEVLVLALPQANGRENQIVAVVEGQVAAVDISQRLVETLEPYQRPRAVKVVEKIPITAAGKFDRKTIVGYFS